MPLRAVVTASTVVDCTQAGGLIEGIKADSLIADKGYDSDEIVNIAQDADMTGIFTVCGIG